MRRDCRDQGTGAHRKVDHFTGHARRKPPTAPTGRTMSAVCPDIHRLTVCCGIYRTLRKYKDHFILILVLKHALYLRIMISANPRPTPYLVYVVVELTWKSPR